MTWEEIVEKQSNEYAAHLDAVRKNKEQLQAGKEAILASANCKESDLPPALKSILERDAEASEKEFGMYGTRFKDMRISHQKELNRFFERGVIVQDLAKSNDNADKKTKDKSAGR